MDITIDPVVGSALYHRYAGQTRPETPYVTLDAEHGLLSAAVASGDGWPTRVYHGHVRRWTIPALKADVANQLLADLVPLATRVCAGYESVWDGHNHVARFNDDAQLARDEISTRIESRYFDVTDCVGVIDASDWLANLGGVKAQCKSLGITGATTDEQLDEIEQTCRAEAAEEEIEVIEELGSHLRYLRNEARS